MIANVALLSSCVRKIPSQSTQKRTGEHRFSNLVAPVLPGRVAVSVMIVFGASFIQLHLTVIQAESIQGLHSGTGFGIVGHFDESETARSVGVAVGHDGHGLNRSVGREKISQLCFGSRGIKVPNENVNHDSLKPLRPVFATVEKTRL